MKRIQNKSQELMMQILYWSLYSMLFAVLILYPNPLHEYFFEPNERLYATLWSLAHLASFVLYRLIRRNPGFVEIENQTLVRKDVEQTHYIERERTHIWTKTRVR